MRQIAVATWRQSIKGGLKNLQNVAVGDQEAGCAAKSSLAVEHYGAGTTKH